MEPEITQQSPAPVEAEVKQTTTDSPEPTLADVAKKYNVEEEVKQFTATPEPQPQQQYQQQQIPQYAPDPILDADGFRNYLASQNQTTANILNQVASTVHELRKEREQEALNAEIKQAVTRVNEKMGIDQTYAELVLEKEYRGDPIFKRIWDNRKVNPQALVEALDVIANRNSKVFQVKTDPQLMENTRAAKASQRAMATTQRTSEETEVNKMSDGEFEHWWNQRKYMG